MAIGFISHKIAFQCFRCFFSISNKFDWTHTVALNNSMTVFPAPIRSYTPSLASGYCIAVHLPNFRLPFLHKRPNCTSFSPSVCNPKLSLVCFVQIENQYFALNVHASSFSLPLFCFKQVPFAPASL